MIIIHATSTILSKYFYQTYVFKVTNVEKRGEMVSRRGTAAVSRSDQFTCLSTTASDARPFFGIPHSNTWHQLCAMFADLPNTKHNAMYCAVAA